jgi:hypothetical protein
MFVSAKQFFYFFVTPAFDRSFLQERWAGRGKDSGRCRNDKIIRIFNVWEKNITVPFLCITRSDAGVRQRKRAAADNPAKGFFFSPNCSYYSF